MKTPPVVDPCGEPMLDPDWTPAHGYAHALELLRAAEAAEVGAVRAADAET